MRISDLRHRITIQRKTIVTDPEEGITTETWTDVATVWAAIEPIRGREYFAAAAVQAEDTVRFRIRYRSDVDPSMRLVYDGRVYNIQSVIDVGGRRREMELMCREVTAGAN